MKNRLIILCISLTCVLGCSTGPDFKRDNVSDPDADQFKPNPPSGANYSLNEFGDVSLHWSDNSDFESGYKVYKKLGNSTSSILLADLNANSTSFIDSTRSLAYPTIYQIVSLSDTLQSDTLSISIDFGTVDNFYSEFSNRYKKVNFVWDSDILFIDGFILSKTVDNAPSEIFVSEISPEQTQVQIDSPQDGFNHEYKITPFLINGSDTTLLANNTSSLITMGPKDLQLRFITEDSLKVSWSDISTFEDEFVITIPAETSTQITTKDTTHIINRNFTKNEVIRINLFAKKEFTNSNLIHKAINASLTKPSIDSLVSNSTSSLTLFTKRNSNTKSEIEVYKSKNGNSFIPIGTILKGDSTFTDNLVQPEHDYSYYLKSRLSDASNIKAYHFKYYPDLTHSLGMEALVDNGLIGTTPDGSYITYLKKNHNTQVTDVYIFDALNEETVSVISDTVNIHKLRFNDEKSSLLIIPYRINDSHLYVYDVNSRSRIFTINLSDSVRVTDALFLSEDQIIYSYINFLTTPQEVFFSRVNLKTNNSTEFTIKDKFYLQAHFYKNKKTQTLAIVGPKSQSHSNHFIRAQYFDIINGSELNHTNTVDTEIPYNESISMSTTLDTLLTIDKRNNTYSGGDFALFDLVNGNEITIFSGTHPGNVRFLKNNLFLVKIYNTKKIIDISESTNEVIYSQKQQIGIGERTYYNPSEDLMINLRTLSEAQFKPLMDFYKLEKKWIEKIANQN